MQAFESKREKSCNRLSKSVSGKDDARSRYGRGHGKRGRSGSRKAWQEAEGGLYDATGQRKYLNAAERGRAMAAMAELDDERALFAFTLAWSGARISEVLALTPSSFQIEEAVVSFATLKRRGLIMREVPIPPDLMQMLDTQFGLARVQSDAARGTIRLWPWSRVTGWRIIKDVMARAGIAGRHACPKAFRHAFGIGTLQANVPINLTQRWLGHTRISTTAIYAAACGPEERAFAQLFWADRPGGMRPIAPSDGATAPKPPGVAAPPSTSFPKAHATPRA